MDLSSESYRKTSEALESSLDANTPEWLVTATLELTRNFWVVVNALYVLTTRRHDAR